MKNIVLKKIEEMEQKREILLKGNFSTQQIEQQLQLYNKIMKNLKKWYNKINNM